MSGLDLLIDTLATERLTRLVVDDELTAPIREYVWKNHPPEETKIGYFLTCPFCASIWAGGVAVLARTVAPRSWRLVGTTLALSGAVSLMRETLDRLD